MRMAFRLLATLSLCLLLASCKVDYSMVRAAPPGVGVAYLTSGPNLYGEGGALVLKINGKKFGGRLTIGYEIQVPVGRNTLYMAHWVAQGQAHGDVVADFEEGGYYVVSPIPDLERRRVRFDLKRVTPAQFQAARCAAQRQVQESMKNINPQKTPACDEIRVGRGA